MIRSIVTYTLEKTILNKTKKEKLRKFERKITILGPNMTEQGEIM